MRTVNLSDRSYQSTEQGKIIKSKRTFGVEVEAVYSDENNLEDLMNGQPSSFGFVHDGSIAVGDSKYAIEVVTPILKGKKGEESVADLLKEMRHFEFGINVSCGMHVHLGAHEFNKTKNSTMLQFENMDLKTINSVNKNKDTIIVVEQQLLSDLVSYTSLDPDDISQMLQDEHASQGTNLIFLSKEFGKKIPDISARPARINISGQEVLVYYYTYEDIIHITDSRKEFNFEDFKPKGSDYVFITKNLNSLNKIKSLLYFYTVFNDIFLAMLPVSRRTNVYCQSLSTSFSPVEIETIETYSELKKKWYKTKSRFRGSNHYDDSRYYNLNLHPLFSGTGTIEIRSHSATLLSNKVLLWTALHQHFFDIIASGKLTIPQMRQATILSSIDDKLSFLFEVTRPSHSLRRYVTKRVDYFNNLNK